jgi:hypothetical protein
VSSQFEIDQTLELTEREQYEHMKDEAIITENLFSARQAFAALLRIKQRRSYRNVYSTFERYVEIKWAALFDDMSRMQMWRNLKHEETLQAFDAENVTCTLQITPPKHINQSEALSPLPAHERPAAFALAQEITGKEQPSSAEVAATVKSLEPGRMDFVDMDKGPKWIDARAPANDVTPGTSMPTDKPREYRRTTDISCDGHRLCYQNVIPTARGVQKWWGAMTRRQWEAAGLVFKGIPQTEFEDEDDLRTTEDMPDGVSPDVRAAVAKERERIAAINGTPIPPAPAPTKSNGKKNAFAGPDPLANFFPDDEAQPEPPEDAPVGSFIADTDFSDLDALTQPFGEEYPQ